MTSGVRLNRAKAPYTLADLDERMWPVPGDYLWIADAWTVIVTDAEPTGEGLAYAGLSCVCPIDDRAVAWGASPHEWTVRTGLLLPGRPFRILPAQDWPRLPQVDDQLHITAEPPHRFLLAAAVGEVSDGWRVAGPLYDSTGTIIDANHELELAVHDRVTDA